MSTNWRKTEDGMYLSHHILMQYVSRSVPRYALRRNPYGDGWVVLEFTQSIGTYKQLPVYPLPSLQETKKFVDKHIS